MSAKSTESSKFGLSLERVRELNRQGVDWCEAVEKALLEHNIENWPVAWGDALQVFIYGDFMPPSVDLHFPSLGITVHHETVVSSVVQSALCVLKATVTVGEKSVTGIVDATRRMNVLLGTWTLVAWGNGACGWWSDVTRGTFGGVATQFAHEDLDRAIGGIVKLPSAVRQKIDAALYWVREPRNLMLESYCRSDVFRRYVGYWNAFECLVEAVHVLAPPPKLSKTERQKQLDTFIAARHGKLTSADVVKCYQDIVNLGFVGKASHALRVCFPDEASTYIEECFRMPDRRNRLYDVRNAINHGEIDAEHPDELFRVGSRLYRLWKIVWRMFGWFVPFPVPAEANKGESAGPMRAHR